jgi:hypothetical protein
MIDQIRKSQVPATVMQLAARGALLVPPEEMIEILVHLALHHKVFGEQARMTLASWDEKACLAAAGDPRTSPEVLGYFVSPENLRIRLLPALAENRSVGEEPLLALVASGSREVVETLLASKRVKSSPTLLKALRTNANVDPAELEEIEARPAPVKPSPSLEVAAEPEAADQEVEGAVVRYLEENAAELAAEKDKPFQPIGVIHEGAGGEAGDALASAAAAPESATPQAAKSDAERLAAAAAHAKKHAPPGHKERRDSTLQKIAKLDTKSRIALAVRGNKEERSILIRDGTKLVALAVLESPKVSDGEVENFASQKNVLEAVLRAIPLKRRFAKNYNIVRNLVYNPRTPIDLSLSLMKNLLVHDLKNLSANKEVADTIRKLALRMFKQKIEKKG